jgi:hypothetical protein
LSRLEVRLVESERFRDSQSRSPKDNDQPANAKAVWPLTGTAHDRDDLFDARRSAG